MSENHISSITPMDTASIANDTAVNRLFEVTTSGGNTRELAQLDALVYGRLTRAYDDSAIPVQHQANRAT